MRSTRYLASIALINLTLACALCNASTSETSVKALTVLLYSPPLTLHPRNSLDGIGQQLGALIFRGLTKLDENLAEQGDLAESWEIRDSGKQIRFKIRKGLKDHAGGEIDAAKVAACLNNYKVGKPSRHIAAFPNWKETVADKDRVVVKFDKPDPYFTRNVLLLRYYVGEGDTQPCLDTKPEQRVIGSGMMKPSHWEAAPEKEILLLPAQEGLRATKFVFVMDDNARTLKLLRGDVDVVHNSFSLPRTRWVETEHADRFKLLEREGTTISYLIFNMKDPILSRTKVRHAIGHAINREEWVKHKMFKFGSVAGSLLFKSLPEAHLVDFAYDPARAEKLLDEAGYPRGKNGRRFKLRYKLTSFREAAEQALHFQNCLRKVGIELVLDVVEPAVWAESVKRGAYQMSAGRFIGVSDGSIFYRTLRTGQTFNRAAYSNPELDALLDKYLAEPELVRRKEMLKLVQLKMAEDLPYMPLWHWAGGTLLRKDLGGLESHQLSLSGALEPLLKIR